MTLHNSIKFDPPQNGWHLNHLIIPKRTYVFHPAELPPQLVGFTEGLFDVDHGWTNIYFFGKRVVIFPGKNGVGISGQIDAPGSQKTTIFQSGWWVSQPPSILVGGFPHPPKGSTHFSKWWQRLPGDECYKRDEFWKKSWKRKGHVRIYSTKTHLENIGKKVPFFEAAKVAVLRGNSSWWKWTSQRLFSRHLGQFKVFFVAGTPVANRTVSCHPIGGIGRHPCETGVIQPQGDESSTPNPPKNLHDFATLLGGWTNPIRKICASQIGPFPQKGMNIQKKMFELPPPSSMIRSNFSSLRPSDWFPCPCDLPNFTSFPPSEVEQRASLPPENPFRGKGKRWHRRNPFLGDQR